MANPNTVFAHVTKLIVTIVCMKFFKDSYSIQAHDQIWAVRAFQMLLVHSVLGIIRYGSPSTTKRFRTFYERFSNLIEIMPFSFFTMEIMVQYTVYEEIRVPLLFVSLTPAAIEVLSISRDRQKLSLLTDIIIMLQSLALLSFCLQLDAYMIISLSVSYAVTRFVSGDFCDRYDVPYVDLSQYSLCFVEIFAMTVLKDF